MRALAALLVTALLSLATSPAAAAPAPPERFVGRDASMVVAFPSLRTALEQASGLLATAASFPGGEALEKKRAKLEREFGFDLLAPAWLEEAGIDPARPAAVSMIALDAEGEEADFVFVLPVANPARFEKTIARLAREGELGPKSALPGTPRVTVYRPKEDGEDALAYAITEGHAVLTMQAGAIPRVKAALELPRPRQLATLPAYGALSRTLGAGMGIIAYVPPGSAFAPGDLKLEGGYAMGLAAGAGGVHFAMALSFSKDEPLVRAAAVDAAPLLGKLHPGPFVVMRNGTDLRAFFTADDLLDPFGTRKTSTSPEVRALVKDVLSTLGGGLALGVSAVEPSAKEDGRPTLSKAPFAYFRGEAVIGVADPARLRSVLRRWLTENAKGERLSEDGPWAFDAMGGEVGLAVEKRRLLLAFGPKGALKALSGRSGTTLTAPTAGAARALAGGPSGVYLDVPKLVETLRSLPASAFGTTAKGRREHQGLQAILPILSRFREIALWSELSGSTLRLEVSVEVEPATAEDAEADSGADADAEAGEDEGESGIE